MGFPRVGGQGSKVEEVVIAKARSERNQEQQRTRQEWLRSLEEPHPDSITTASLGLERWRQEPEV